MTVLEIVQVAATTQSHVHYFFDPRFQGRSPFNLLNESECGGSGHRELPSAVTGGSRRARREPGPITLISQPRSMIALCRLPELAAAFVHTPTAARHQTLTFAVGAPRTADRRLTQRTPSAASGAAPLLTLRHLSRCTAPPLTLHGATSDAVLRHL